MDSREKLHNPPPRRRMKQVRFGKLAFPQLNGAFFQLRPVFGHFARCFQGKTGKLALWLGNRAHFHTKMLDQTSSLKT